MYSISSSCSLSGMCNSAHKKKMFKECSQNLGIYVGGIKGVMWPHLCRKKWASLIWFKSMVVAICTGWYKNWHGLYESSYYYHIIWLHVTLMLLSWACRAAPTEAPTQPGKHGSHVQCGPRLEVMKGSHVMTMKSYFESLLLISCLLIMYTSSTQLLNALTRALVQTKRPKFKKQFSGQHAKLS